MSEPLSGIGIPKANGTHADILAAVGLADLLASDGEGSPRLVEEPDRFVVELGVADPERLIADLHIQPGYPFLQTSEKVKVPEGVQPVVDYKEEKERVDRYRKLQEQIARSPALRQDEAVQEQLRHSRPLPEWRLLQVLNVMQGDENSNRVHATICAASVAERRSWVEEGLQALATGETSRPPWKVKLVQIFTPNAAKGYARLKPDSTQRGDSTKEQWADPFLEWLKYRGYFRVACPYFLGSKGEHIRLLCPVPADIGVRALEAVATELRRSGIYGSSPAKLDSLAVLALARILIEHSQEYHAEEVSPFPGLEMAGRTPAKVISGVAITHYQSLGSARAVSAMETLALPDWFTITGPARAAMWLLALEDHRRAVRVLDDSHSDEIGLLIQYRRFLEQRGGPALQALLDFMGAYGQFLIRARERGRRVPAFRTDCFKEVVEGLKAEYTRILEDPGFRAVAAAVRQATVTAQYWKSKGQEHREIRYDLIPELRRKRSLSQSGPFIEVVADFVSAYNVENARRREMRRLAPGNVTTEQFDALCHLVEEHGAPLVGALLCAYGTCREPRETPSDEQTQEPEGAPEPDPIEASVGE